MRRGALAVLAAAAVPAGCGAGTPRAVAPAPRERAAAGAGASRPAVCGRLHPRVTGAVGDAGAVELSGLVLSRRQPGVLWAHNDSGDRPRVFAVRPDGTVLADLGVPGAQAVDWEDVAIGPARPGGPPDQLYLGDIGDNGATRREIDIYRVPEPRVPASGVTAPAVRLRLRYPDGAHDAETLLVDPGSAQVVVVTKRLDGRSGAYAAPASAAGRPGVTTLRRIARLDLGPGALATGGDVSADGRVVAIRTYGGLVAWRRAPGASLAATLRRPPCVGVTALAAEGQGEALALTAHGDGFFTVPEGRRPPIRRYGTG